MLDMAPSRVSQRMRAQRLRRRRTTVHPRPFYVCFLCIILYVRRNIFILFFALVCVAVGVFFSYKNVSPFYENDELYIKYILTRKQFEKKCAASSSLCTHTHTHTRTKVVKLKNKNFADYTKKKNEFFDYSFNRIVFE